MPQTVYRVVRLADERYGVETAKPGGSPTVTVFHTAQEAEIWIADRRWVATAASRLAPYAPQLEREPDAHRTE